MVTAAMLDGFAKTARPRARQERQQQRVSLMKRQDNRRAIPEPRGRCSHERTPSSIEWPIQLPLRQSAAGSRTLVPVSASTAMRTPPANLFERRYEPGRIKRSFELRDEATMHGKGERA
jgi:hypothetical protein